jgi:uncharacterized membrane protein
MTTTSTRSRTLAAAVGLVLSTYALYVEYRMEQNHHGEPAPFTALCDIAAIGASCSKVFGLPVGHLLSYLKLVPKGSVLDLPNAALGVLHYTYLLLVAPAAEAAGSGGNRALRLLTSVAVASAFASTVYLAYQLTFVVHDLCVLCWSVHVINAYIGYDHFFRRSGGSGSSSRRPLASTNKQKKK